MHQLLSKYPQNFLLQNYHGDILVDDLDKAFHSLLSMLLQSSDFNIAGATITED